MNYLALDIGKRRTGVAFLPESTGVPVPLETIAHTSEAQLIERVTHIITDRGVGQLVIGLPLLPDGSEGEQALYVRAVADTLRAAVPSILFRDERYTTVKVHSAKHARHSPPPSSYDGDAAAACALLLSLHGA